MRSSTLLSVLAAATLTLGAGCGATVNSQVAPGANLSQYRTFSFYTSPYRASQPSTVLDQTIRGALRQDLQKKGFVEATNAPPDFLVSYHARVQQKLGVDDVGYGWWGFPAAADLYTYDEGTLIVDFVDPRTKSVFWRGTASQTADNPENPSPGKVQAAVDKLVKKYPYNVASAPPPPRM